MHNAVTYFCNRDINVYVTVLEASKEFDRINHNKLFALLKKRNVPESFINVVID